MTNRVMYYVNTNKHGQKYEVHQYTTNCPHPANPENRHYLGYYSSCKTAVARAKELGYTPANGCFFCSRGCHKP